MVIPSRMQCKKADGIRPVSGTRSHTGLQWSMLGRGVGNGQCGTEGQTDWTV